MKIFTPKSEEEAANTVIAAKKTGTHLRIVGGGTRSTIGRAMQADASLSTAALSGITLYEPNEMVISAMAGTPLSVSYTHLTLPTTPYV